MAGRKYMPVSLTRVDKCPTCGGRVERSYTDIFFPYCGYTCKRVVQKEEERREKLKIEKRHAWLDKCYMEDLERNKRYKRKTSKDSTQTVTYELHSIKRKS